MKTCFKCNRKLPLSEFYKHRKMADGHIGKCRSCAIIDAREWFSKKSQNSDWREEQMEMRRFRGRRYQTMGRKSAPTKSQKRKTLTNYRIKFPERYAAKSIFDSAVKRGIVKKEPCKVCGDMRAQGHHEDYFKPLEVVWLCTTHHAERHVELRKIARKQKTI